MGRGSSWAVSVTSPVLETAFKLPADPCADLGCLMPASLELPHQCLMTAVKDMQALQDQAEEGTVLTRDMIKARKRMAELATAWGVRSAYFTGSYILSGPYLLSAGSRHRLCVR